MKKIYRFLFTSVALLSLIPLAFGDGEGSTEPQKGPDYYMNEDGSIGYMKKISEPNTDGVYTITLESFATGQSVKLQKSIPADIVLVLDVSGSMDEDLVSYTYTGINREWTYNNFGNTIRYYLHSDGNYYQVHRDGNGNNRRLYFDVGTTRWYLWETGAQTNQSTGVGQYVTIFSGTLYTRQQSGSRSRLAALKDAVNAFIDKIDENDRIDPIKNQPRTKRLGNRIAIVAYSGPRNAGSETPTANNSIKLNTGWYTLGNNQDVNDYTGRDYLKNTAVRGLQANGGTFSNFGMEAAKTLLTLDDTHQLRTAVLFTDGDPGRGTYWTTTTPQGGHYCPTNDYGLYTWRTANQAIQYANDIKLMADDDKGIISKVYSVSVINDPSSYTNVYLDQVSSNYSGAEYMAELLPYGNYYYIDNWNPNNPWTARTGTKIASTYAFTADDEDSLMTIFETIAGENGGGSEDLGEATIAQVDVVSASFMLPNGTDKSQIKVYISKVKDEQTRQPKTYLDDDGNEQSDIFLEFDTPKRSDPDNNIYCGYTYTKVVKNADGTTTEYPNTKVDGSIDVSFDEDNPNKVIVTGFDYAAHWCGPVFDEGYEDDYDHVIRWNGYKLIVEIPIKMDPNAVGGADVATNAEGSGVIVNGVNVAPFRSPQVSLPINIHIRKEGLDVGESAKFAIERKLLTDPETAWNEVSTVFVTRHKGQDIKGTNAPICKVVGMPSVDENDRELIYRVVEKNWNWAYNLVSIKSSTGATIGNISTRSATSAELVTNPFIFVNEKIDNIDFKVRHAESKATNTFKTGVSKNDEYDDSKDNGRPVITVSTSE